MSNIVITITPPTQANLVDGTLRIFIGGGAIDMQYAPALGVEPRRFSSRFADLDPATRAAGLAFFNALVANDGALTKMGF